MVCSTITTAFITSRTISCSPRDLSFDQSVGFGEWGSSGDRLAGDWEAGEWNSEGVACDVSGSSENSTSSFETLSSIPNKSREWPPVGAFNGVEDGGSTESSKRSGGRVSVAVADGTAEATP